VLLGHVVQDGHEAVILFHLRQGLGCELGLIEWWWRLTSSNESVDKRFTHHQRFREIQSELRRDERAKFCAWNIDKPFGEEDTALADQVQSLLKRDLVELNVIQVLHVPGAGQQLRAQGFFLTLRDLDKNIRFENGKEGTGEKASQGQTGV